MKILEVEYAFREAAEESRSALLEHVAARAQESRSGRQHPPKRKEIVLVTTGAVQEQEGWRIRAVARFPAVDVQVERGIHLVIGWCGTPSMNFFTSRRPRTPAWKSTFCCASPAMALTR